MGIKTDSAPGVSELPVLPFPDFPLIHVKQDRFFYRKSPFFSFPVPPERLHRHPSRPCVPLIVVYFPGKTAPECPEKSYGANYPLFQPFTEWHEKILKFYCDIIWIERKNPLLLHSLLKTRPLVERANEERVL